MRRPHHCVGNRNVADCQDTHRKHGVVEHIGDSCPSIGPGYRVGITTREPAERHRKDRDNDHGKPEHGHRAQRKHEGELTETTPATPCGPRSESTSNDGRNDQGRNDQEGRPHEAIYENLENRPSAAVPKRRTEIAAHEVAEIPEVLREQRFIEALGAPQGRDPLGSHLPDRISCNQSQRIAGKSTR